MKTKTYRIVRFYAPHLNLPPKRIRGKSGLTLKEAQDHCKKEDTKKDGEWFDGYQEE